MGSVVAETFVLRQELETEYSCGDGERVLSCPDLVCMLQLRPSGVQCVHTAYLTDPLALSNF